MTIYDRHLFRSYLWILVVLFISTFGLFCIIDLMDNFDDFWTNNEGRGTASLLYRMAYYYGHFAFFFFDAAGRSLAVLAVITLLILLDRGGELKPLLAAGVPTYRLALPIVFGAVAVNVLHVLNREFVIPPRAHVKYANRGKLVTLHLVVSVYDHASKILVDGEKLNLEDDQVEKPRFVLPSPSIAHELTTVVADSARFYPERGDRPAGWVLEGVSPQYGQLPLTNDGRQLVRRFTDEPTKLFVQTSVSARDLYKGNDNATMLSTPDLLQRIRNPSYSLVLARTLVLHFHERMVAPALCIAYVLLVIPLIIRRNSRGMVSNAALCLLVMGLLFGVQQGFAALGQLNLVSPALAAWGPLVACGGTFASISDFVQT